MEEDEREAINAYKIYFKTHLPRVDSLNGLWSADFDYEFYSKGGKLDEIDALHVYLKKLKPYAKVLAKAAELRESHYTRFIEEEERGHRDWRIGLNMVAQDAKDKVIKWQHVWEEKMDKVIRDYTPTLSGIKQIAHFKNVDVFEKESKTAVEPPQMSSRERKKRKNARRRRKAREDEDAINKAVSQLSLEREKLLGQLGTAKRKIYPYITVATAISKISELNLKLEENNYTKRVKLGVALGFKNSSDDELRFVVRELIKPWFNAPQMIKWNVMLSLMGGDL